MNKSYKNIIITLLISFIAYFVANEFFTEVQSRLIGCVVFLVAMWTNESLPLGVVSLLPIILFPSLDILAINDTTANYSKSIIFLFLGGFLMAIAVEKTGLHKVIAYKLLSIFSSTARGIIFALAITSAVLSSLLSNTTTALLLMPIALFLTDIKKLQVRLILAVAYGASIGGIITPIGTPPNLILMGFLQENNLPMLTFVEWTLKTIPLSIVMLIIVPFILSLGSKSFIVQKDVENKQTLNSDQIRLLVILSTLVIVLFANSFFKISEAGILLGYGLMMFLPKIGFIEWEDTRRVPYEIMFLFGAGFSIAKAFSTTNLASDISNLLLNLTELSPILLILLVATLITFTTEVTSNTALISIALPIIYSLGMSANIDVSLLLMVATICASYAFMLPIATPPNAIAMSSKVVTIKDMASYGIFFNLIAVCMTTIVAIIIW